MLTEKNIREEKMNKFWWLFVLLIGCGDAMSPMVYIDTTLDEADSNSEEETETSSQEVEDTNSLEDTVTENISDDESESYSDSESESESEWEPKVPVWTDSSTGLIWSIDSVANLSLGLARIMCKKIGMRVPTFDEATSIIAPCYSVDNIPDEVCINQNLNMLECFEVTSTMVVEEDTDVSGPSMFRGLAYMAGVVYRDFYENQLGVCSRCVRSE